MLKIRRRKKESTASPSFPFRTQCKRQMNRKQFFMKPVNITTWIIFWNTLNYSKRGESIRIAEAYFFLQKSPLYETDVWSGRGWDGWVEGGERQAPREDSPSSPGWQIKPWIMERRRQKWICCVRWTVLLWWLCSGKRCAAKKDGCWWQKVFPLLPFVQEKEWNMWCKNKWHFTVL